MEVKWGEPYSMKVGFRNVWRREWCIPPDMLGGFFTFWKRTRFKMLAEGFSVTKSPKTGKWYLFETKDNVKLFSSFGFEDSTHPIDPFVLPEYQIKNVRGLRTWQVEATGKLCAAIKQWGAAVDGSDTGCHAKGQPILMADGTVKNVEDIVVGDIVMGWQGPQTVMELKRGRQQMAKIIPKKGKSFVVNLDHVLTVILTNGSHKTTGGYRYGSIVDIKVKDYLKLLNTTKCAMKLFSVAINSWESKNLPFNPYFVGALLGDGGMSSRSTVTFTSEKSIMWEMISDECNANGWKLGSTNEHITWRITKAPALFKWLRDSRLFPVSCGNKFVPHDYKTGSRTQRLQLLAGLLDTDGHYHHSNGYEITLKSFRLSEDIVFIARSLGLSAYTKSCTKKSSTGVVGNYFRTHISGNVDIIPCRVDYKKAYPRKQKKDVLRRGFEIELLEEDDYYGFSLDGDGRFLLGDFTVTHNTGKTYSAVAVARELGLKICVICPKAVIKKWKTVIIKHFGLKDSLVDVVNYEKLIRGNKDSKIASFVLPRHARSKKFEWNLPKKTLIIWDEAHKLKNWKTQNAKRCNDAIGKGYPMLFCSATMATNPLEMRAIGRAVKLFTGNRSYYDWVYDNGVYKGTWGLEFNNDKNVLKRLHHQLFIQRGVRLRRDSIPNFPACEIIPDVYNMDEQDSNKINEIFYEMEQELELVRQREKEDKKRAEKVNRELQEIVIQIRARQKIELIKVPLFVEMIEEAKEEGFSVAVFVNFTETLQAIADRIKTTCIFDGKTPDKIREKNIELFQSDKERIIIVNIQSGGVGLDLHDLNGNFPRISLISPSYSVGLMKQSLGRIWRDSAKTKSLQKIVCVANTVEENVCHNLQQKLNNLSMINDGEFDTLNILNDKDLEYSRNQTIDI